jgi:hypothetical protein
MALPRRGGSGGAAACFCGDGAGVGRRAGKGGAAAVGRVGTAGRSGTTGGADATGRGEGTGRPGGAGEGLVGVAGAVCAGGGGAGRAVVRRVWKNGGVGSE